MAVIPGRQQNPREKRKYRSTDNSKLEIKRGTHTKKKVCLRLHGRSENFETT